ncbi:MAG TPA: hypothetical protein IGS17_04945 [Oscillatoriales cyanobacterium M59_W2019_021]|nr:hypothetical protein [Oscillatoriales cyanobacterium M4454_W2019_049]HIK50262.1 hypothetical protein [Oscillatoriales cyanobacterium M59_W2019_021]
METLEKLSSLESLEQRLQQCLSDRFSPDNALGVECLLEDEKLKVWVQHDPATFLEEQSAFAALQAVLEGMTPPPSSQVRLYLKREGQKQPYAVRAFKITDNISETKTPPPPLPKPPVTQSSGDLPLKGKTRPNPRSTAKSHSPEIPEFLEKRRQSDLPETGNDRPTFPTTWEEWRQWLPLGVAAAVAGSLLVLGLGYAVTRPCVIGGCKAIARSQELSQNAIQTLDAQRSTEALLAARQQLNQAEDLVRDIPLWSVHYGTARDLVAMYRNQSQALDQTAAALSHAALAGQKSQNPPHPPQVWREVAGLWEKAIAELGLIPESSPTYGFAQHKISEYQANLEAIEQRLALEEKAQAQLQTAKSAAEAAQVSQNLARDVDAWQLAHASWKTTLYALRRVPKGTQAAEDAQQLFKSYEPHIVAARDRYAQEQIAANFYNQALSFGDRAKTAQNDSEWTTAITLWQQGLAHARQVPPQTSSYEDAQILISSYTKSLDEAVRSQRRQGLMERANLELSTICTGTTPICEYTVTPKGIKVQILPSYIDYIRDLAQTSTQSNDKQTQTAIDAHKQSLINSFKAVSNNAQLPIELYQKSDGSKIGAYEPKEMGNGNG